MLQLLLLPLPLQVTVTGYTGLDAADLDLGEELLMSYVFDL